MYNGWQKYSYTPSSPVRLLLKGCVQNGGWFYAVLKLGTVKCTVASSIHLLEIYFYFRKNVSMYYVSTTLGLIFAIYKVKKIFIPFDNLCMDVEWYFVINTLKPTKSCLWNLLKDLFKNMKYFNFFTYANSLIMNPVHCVLIISRKNVLTAFFINLFSCL